VKMIEVAAGEIQSGVLKIIEGIEWK